MKTTFGSMRPEVSTVLLLLIAASAPAQNGAAIFTAPGQAVAFTNAPSLVSAGGYTIEAWGRLTAFPPGTTGMGTWSPNLVTNPAGSSGLSYMIDVYAATSVDFDCSSGFVEGAQGGGGFSLLDAWHHIAATFTPTSAKVYIDGVLVATGMLGGQPAPYFPGTGLIGAWTTSGSPIDLWRSSWHGEIDEFRIWNYARTATEINEDLHRVLDQRDGLVAAWHFDGDFTDSAGGFDGVPLNGVAIAPSGAPISRAVLTTGVKVAPGAPWVWKARTERTSALYWVDASFGGGVPGTPLPGGVFAPINRPWLFLDFSAAAPGLFSGFFDVVGPDETGTAVFAAPDFPFLDGLTMTSSFAVLDPATFSVLEVAPATQTLIDDAAPRITAVIPSSVPESGGTVAVHGAGFLFLAAATVGGEPAPLTFVSPGTFLCAVPPGQAGPAEIVVKNWDGGTAFFPTGFSYVGDLEIDAVSPAFGPAGTVLEVFGEDFIPGTSATLGGIPVSVLSVTPTRLTVVVPSGVPCDALLTATTPDGQSESVVWNESPDIVTVINPQGPTAGGGSLLLLGAFVPSVTVTIGGSPATVVASSATTLVVVAPPGPPGIAEVVVTNAFGCSAQAGYLYL